MEVICNRKVLHRALQSVGRAVSTRSTLPILSNVLLKATKEGLSLLTSDLEIWMEYLLPAAAGKEGKGAVEVTKTGAITIPARLLGDVVVNLPDATVQLRVDEDGTLQLVCGASQYEIRGLPAEEFPSFPEVAGEAFEIKQGVLAELIEKTSFAASTDETRAILTGVLLTADGKAVRMVATDAYRLSMKGTEIADAPKDISVLIPARALRELSRLLVEKENKVEIKVGPSQILFRLPSNDSEQPGELCLVSRLIEGQFPSFEKLIPKEWERRLSLQREDFLATIKRCAIIARTEANKIIFESQGNKLKVRAESADYGKVEEELPVSLEGEGIQIAFNGAYLQDALEVMTSDMVWVELSGAISHGVLRPSDDPDHFCLVAPMQVI